MKQKLLHSFVLRVCLLVAFFASAVSGAWADSYEYTFESNAWSQNGSATLNNVSWTLNMDGGTISSFSSTQGMHFGTNNSTCNSVTISSSGISGTITSVKVEASRGSSLVGTLGIKVGSTAFKVNNSETNALTTSNAEYDFTGNDNGNIEIKWTKTSGKGAYYIKKITITYSTSGNLTTSDLALTGAPVALSFDLYNNASAQVINYSTSSTGAVTVVASDYVTTVVNTSAKTITVTPKKKTNSTQTITVNQAADATYAAGSATFTVDIDDSTPATNYERVTDANQLVAGNKYILVASTNNGSFAMGSMGTNLRNYVAVTVENDVVAIQNEEIAILTLGGTSGAWTFLASDNSEYLSYSGSSNQLHSSDDADANASKWVVYGGNDGFYLESANVSGRYLQYNTGSPRFACYTGSQTNAYLYVKEGSAINSKADPAFSFSANSAEANLGESFTAPTFNNPNNVSVTFDSSDPSVASITNEGVVTLLAAGTTVISATSVEDENYLAGSASYTLTVTDPNAPGCENNPYTVAQAITNTPSSGNVYIKGIVSAFYGTSIMDDGSNYRYYISDDGSTTDQLLVYKGKGLNNVAFANADDIQIGDEVIVYGGLTTYSNAPEVASGNYIVSRKPSSNLAFSEATASVNLGESFTAPTLTYADGVTGITYSSSVPAVATVDENTGVVTILTAGETVITASFVGDATFSASQASYTLTVVDPAEPVDICTLNSITPTELTVGDMGDFTLNATFVDGVTEGTDYVISWTSSNTSILDLSDETYEAKAAGSVTITVSVIVDDNGTYKDVQKEFAVTVSEPMTYVALVADLGNGAGKALTLSVGSQDVDIVNGKVVNGEADNISWYITAKNDTYKIQAKTNDNYLTHSTATSGSARTNLTVNDGYNTENEILWKETSKGKFGSENGRDQAVQWSISSSAFKNYAGDTSGNYIAVVDYTFASGDVRTGLTADDTWGTICVPYTVAAADMAGAEFYSIVGKTEDGSGNLESISLTKEEGALEAGHSYLFKATAEKLVVAYSGDKANSPVASNGLVGAYEESSVAQGKYILKNGQLYLVNTDNVYIRGNRAYIDASQITEKPAGVKAFTLYVGNTPTGINALDTKDAQTPAYNLAGQRVQKTTKGLYIVGGKKVVVK